jgi:hypothetical protein
LTLSIIDDCGRFFPRAYPVAIERAGAESGSESLTKATKCGMGIPLLAHHSQIDEKLLQIDE